MPYNPVTKYVKSVETVHDHGCPARVDFFQSFCKVEGAVDMILLCAYSYGRFFFNIVADVEKKMASIRTMYGRSLGPKKSGSGRSSSLPPWLHERMHFIRVHIKARKATISSLEVSKFYIGDRRLFTETFMFVFVAKINTKCWRGLCDRYLFGYSHCSLY